MSKRFIQIIDEKGKVHVRPFDDVALTDTADILEDRGIVRLENGQTFIVTTQELERINALLIGDQPAPQPTAPADPVHVDEAWWNKLATLAWHWQASQGAIDRAKKFAPLEAHMHTYAVSVLPANVIAAWRKSKQARRDNNFDFMCDYDGDLVIALEPLIPELKRETSEDTYDEASS